MDFEQAVVVGSYSDRSTAEAIVSLLASEGIEAVVSSDDAGGELPNLDIGSSIKVLVEASNAEFARQLLDVGES